MNRNPSPATRFKKGQSGNPKGRPKLPSIQEALAACLAEEKDGKTALELTLGALRMRAIKGDVRAAEALLDRAYGKAIQRTDVTSGDKPIAAPPIAWIPVPHVEPPR